MIAVFKTDRTCWIKQPSRLEAQMFYTKVNLGPESVAPATVATAVAPIRLEYMRCSHLGLQPKGDVRRARNLISLHGQQMGT
jgi:hypothetical protein